MVNLPSGDGFEMHTQYARGIGDDLQQHYNNLKTLLEDAESKRRQLVENGFIGLSSDAFSASHTRWQQGEDQMNVALATLTQKLEENIDDVVSNDSKVAGLFG